MSEKELETLEVQSLADVHGGAACGMNPDAAWIMQRESGGNPRAQNPTSSAYGAFQMIKATRKAYMGADWQSSNLCTQYQGASRYVNERYGSWAKARQFWQRNHWY